MHSSRRFSFFEHYDSSGGLVAHLMYDHTKHLLENLATIGTAKPLTTFYKKVVFEN